MLKHSLTIVVDPKTHVFVHMFLTILSFQRPDQFEDSTGKLMMLPSDMVLVQDPSFKKIVEIYAKDENAFFADFASAFSKLLELGVDYPSVKPWYKFW